MAYLLNRRCAAVYCRISGRDGKLRMFSFPVGKTEKQQQRYDIWADVAGNSELKIRRPKVYLCEKHFTERQFMDADKYRLARGAIPSKAAWLTSSASADTSSNECPLTVVCPKEEVPVEIKQEISEDPLKVEPYLDEGIPVKTEQEISEDPLRSESCLDEVPVAVQFEVSKDLLRTQPLLDEEFAFTINEESSEHVLRVELLQNEDVSFHVDKEPSENMLRVRLLQNEDIFFHIKEESSEDTLRTEFFQNQDISAHIKEEPSEDSLS